MMNYVTEIRRELHRFPEIGFDLPRTTALVKRELEAMGLSYTEQYGKSSVVATLCPEKAAAGTLALRADMDALPITEKTGSPYASEIAGRMHACGHDAHTAILLAALRELTAEKDRVPCAVRAVFQAAEEVAPSGAKLMAADGVMDGVDRVYALHCDPAFPAGTVAVSAGVQSASSYGFTLDFFGKSAHVSRQEEGRDAIMMAVRAYSALEFLFAKEFPLKTDIAFNVGSIHGGNTNNCIADACSLYCTLRTYEPETEAFAVRRVREICEGVAASARGRFVFTEMKHYPAAINDTAATADVCRAAASVVGAGRVLPKEVSMIGEDFAYFEQLVPGCMYRLGTAADPEKATGLHTDTFAVDEAALPVGVAVMKQLVFTFKK